MRPPAAILLGLSTAIAGLAGIGCDQRNDLAAALASTGRELEQARRKNDELEAVVRDQKKQIETLQGLGGPDRVANLYHVKKIELGGYTAGANTDGRPGDDGVKVYILPVDQHGSVLKAAGSVSVKLFDLAADPNNLVGRLDLDAAQLAKNWYGGFGVYHYSFICPWQAAPPAHNEITVRVEFTELLTGKTFSAQTLCKVVPPQPATAPAAK